MDKLRYVRRGHPIRKALNGWVPLIGFRAAPDPGLTSTAEAAVDDYRLSKPCSTNAPTSHQMLAINADAVALYLNAQIEAGARGGDDFHSWGALADASSHLQLPHQRVLAQLKREHQYYLRLRSPRAAASGWNYEAARLRGAGL
jgi:uroporphyrinogen decarboxylase